MTEFSIPHSGKTTGDAGPYSSEQWARLWRTLYSGILRNDASIIPDTGNGTDDALWVEETSPASTQVQINTGAALVKGYWYESTAIETIQIAPNSDASGDDRIDLIVLRLDITNQDVRLEVLEGTVAPVPVAPTPTKNATIWEVPIAQIAVANNFMTITDANITNTVRTFFAAVHPKVGGTGKYDDSAWIHREMLEGGSDNEISYGVHSMATYGVNGDSAQTTIDAWEDITDDNVGVGSTMEVIDDPDGLIASISSDGITVTYGGLYRVGFVCRAFNSSGSTGKYQHRAYNVDQTTVVIARSYSIGTTTTEEVYVETQIEIEATEELRWQVYGNRVWKTVDQAGSAGGGVGPSGENTHSIVFTIQRIAQGA
jgi:hypothetical protein